MSLRNITIASTTRSTPVRITSEATTWGQLKDSLRNDFRDLEQMRAVVRETRNDLASDDAVLPTGDFSILMSPKQIKAGGLDVKAILRDLAERFTDSVEEIIVDIEDGDYVDESTTTNVAADATLMSELKKLKEGTF